jgi:hypothetical protein
MPWWPMRISFQLKTEIDDVVTALLSLEVEHRRLCAFAQGILRNAANEGRVKIPRSRDTDSDHPFQRMKNPMESRRRPAESRATLPIVHEWRISVNWQL